MTLLVPPNPDAATSLMLALVDSSRAPLVLLDGELRVVAASASFYDAFDANPLHTLGQLLSEIGAGEWGRPQLGSMLRAAVSGFDDIQTYEMDLIRRHREPRTVVLTVHKLDYGIGEQVRLMVTIADVTDARASELLKTTLMHEKALLLQELQHRVANSLQIVASILLQSARKVQSEETRTHLFNAHNRVQSVAEMQKQLVGSGLGSVELRSYFSNLCESIGASMIHDAEQISVRVLVDDTMADGDTSVSLGLIVTELMINALKHAFPDQRKGRIVVNYHSAGSDWALSVADDGIGMPKDSDNKPGLGTGIVEALAKQLGGKIDVADNAPGTLVSVTALPRAKSKPALRAI